MLKLENGAIPKILKVIPDAPKLLYVSGDNFSVLLQKPRVAVVGTRTVTPYGRAVTESLTRDLVLDGVVIVSGLALGVDSIAHKVAIEQNGGTIAVLPGGINKIYPRGHEQLGRQIVSSGGALISEKQSHMSPRAYDFLTRNRIISGLSDAILITEAAIRSGSLNTARHALEQGKPVFAVPGDITSPYSEGTNNLIKMGASLVSSVKDIYAVMGWEFSSIKASKPVKLPENQMIIYNLIKAGVLSGEQLYEKSKLAKNEFNEALTMLEIEDLIAALGGNVWRLK